MKKAFTLIELLAVIVILAVIALIATPLVLDVIDDSRYGAARVNETSTTKAAELYYATNQELLPAAGLSAYVSTTSLLANGNLSDLNNPFSNGTGNGYVTVTNTGDSYEYVTFINYYENFETPVTDHLEASYSFNSSSTDIIYDLSGNGLNFESNASTSPTADNGSFVFNGTSDYIEIDDHSAIDASEGTISARFKYNYTGANQMIFIGGSDNSAVGNSNDKLFIGINSAGRLTAGWQTSTEPDIANTPLTLTDGNWYQIDLVWSLSPSNVSLYIDGFQYNGDVLTGDNKSNWINQVRIGRALGSSTDYFEGSIDYLNIYSRRLTDDEIIYKYKLNK